MSHVTNDLLSKVNMIKTHFKWLPHDLMYELFKTYCMPLYGSYFCDLSSPSINKLYVAWRKSVRCLLKLPNRTHSYLLPLICDDIPINVQLSVRFVKFFKSLYSSSNHITVLCAKLALLGSRSSVSNNLTYVSELYNVCRCIIPQTSNNIQMKDKSNMEGASIAELVRELLSIKYENLFMPYHQIYIPSSDIDCIIEAVCCT